MKKYIFVFGGDGYIGWPLSVKLSLLKPDYQIIIFDNMFRRKIVKKLGSNSLTNIYDIDDRIKYFQIFHKQKNLSFVKLDLLKNNINKYFKGKKIDYVFNLAQQSSAPYSMHNMSSALFTAQNNELCNMKLLFLIKEFCPHAKYIKLGSFGEYCTTNLDIPEGFFRPSFNNKTSTHLMPYPRQSEDFYHASKINDSNYIHVACKNWDLSVIEIMQSTIFGISTNETSKKQLYTRFDYDQFFGTVINRFVVQAIIKKNLTVYGTGKQRTGLMSLQDSINSMVSILDDKKFKKGHNIINHVTEKKYSINELATKVIKVAKLNGISNLKISRTYDPRYENLRNKLSYKILGSYSDFSIKKTNFEYVLNNMFEEVKKNKDKIKPNVIPPTFNW